MKYLACRGGHYEELVKVYKGMSLNEHLVVKYALKNESDVGQDDDRYPIISLDSVTDLCKKYNVCGEKIEKYVLTYMINTWTVHPIEEFERLWLAARGSTQDLTSYVKCLEHKGKDEVASYLKSVEKHRVIN